MTPDQIKIISGVLTAIGFFALCHQIYWQLRIGLPDRQSKSAFYFLFMTALIDGQLSLSYLGVFTFGNTERGPVFFFAWLVSVIWWSYCTWRHNAAALRKIKDAERRLRKPLDSVMR